MNRRSCARAILLADGFGCALACAGALASNRFGREMAPIASYRSSLSVALGITSASLFAAARSARDEDLGRAALVNGIWTVGCVASLSRQHTSITRTLVRATAIADAFMALAQWHLRSRATG